MVVLNTGMNLKNVDIIFWKYCEICDLPLGYVDVVSRLRIMYIAQCDRWQRAYHDVVPCVRVCEQIIFFDNPIKFVGYSNILWAFF